MTASVPLITDPHDRFLDTLPFVHTRAKKQFIDTIRRVFGDTTGEQKSVQVMLHLSTRKGPKLMEMLANIGRNESEFRVILTGREVDSSLAGLLFDHEGSAKESAVAASKSKYDDDESGCDAQTVAENESSSIGAPSGLMSSSTTPSGQVSSITMPSCLDLFRPIPQCQWQFHTIDAGGGSNSARSEGASQKDFLPLMLPRSPPPIADATLQLVRPHAQGALHAVICA